jgi:hypothetical protein
MNIMIMACQTIREELRLAIKQTGVNYPVIYIESGLHDQPDSLRRQIQESIDKIDNVDILLMAFGYCGNSLLGVKSSQFKMVIPRVDDCISLLLGSTAMRKKISMEMGTYFLTKGWLESDHNLLKEYERCVTRYGEQRALRVMKTMLGHYRRFMVIDTGAYPIESVTPKIREFAEKHDKRHEVTAGSPRLFHKLLLGQWDDEFIILEPGQEVTIDDICADSNDSGASQLAVGFNR